MTRTLRSVHRLLWLLLVVAVGSVFVLALVLRQPAHAEVVVAMGEVRR